ncbi:MULTISPECIES: hypothetical protein [Deinococcus]|uniref:Uncharacterized protein n=1 Tax=Deinococcus marmoris TaxID=249408 RepID=A0A1U7NYM1_9DEIO|nr:hypothetical protein [Deinococcus marmoris]OLV18004.1 hypothetical protein BOO71_0007069 [Deinococcus marmoris]
MVDVRDDGDIPVFHIFASLLPGAACRETPDKGGGQFSCLRGAAGLRQMLEKARWGARTDLKKPTSTAAP